MGLGGVSVGVVLRDTRFVSSTTKKSGQLRKNCTRQQKQKYLQIAEVMMKIQV